MGKNTPVLEPKEPTDNNPPEKNNIEQKTPENEPENLSKKEEFYRVLSEVQKRSETEKNSSKQSVKMDTGGWDMDR